MKKTKRTTQLLAMGALGASLTLVAAPVRAQDTAPPVSAVRFGMMGAAHGEIVRLNISNSSVPDGNLPPPCRATVSLVDIHGDTLLRPDGTPVSKTVNLLAGHSTFLQINANAFLTSDEARLDFRPLVVVEPSQDTTVPPPCVPSLELIVGATGVTRLVNAGVERMERPEGHNHNETLVRDR